MNKLNSLSDARTAKDVQGIDYAKPSSLAEIWHATSQIQKLVASCFDVEEQAIYVHFLPTPRITRNLQRQTWQLQVQSSELQQFSVMFGSRAGMAEQLLELYPVPSSNVFRDYVSHFEEKAEKSGQILSKLNREMSLQKASKGLKIAEAVLDQDGLGLKIMVWLRQNGLGNFNNISSSLVSQPESILVALVRLSQAELIALDGDGFYLSEEGLEMLNTLDNKLTNNLTL